VLAVARPPLRHTGGGFTRSQFNMQVKLEKADRPRSTRELSDSEKTGGGDHDAEVADRSRIRQDRCVPHARRQPRGARVVDHRGRPQATGTIAASAIRGMTTEPPATRRRRCSEGRLRHRGMARPLGVPPPSRPVSRLVSRHPLGHPIVGIPAAKVVQQRQRRNPRLAFCSHPPYRQAHNNHPGAGGVLDSQPAAAF
jgi:hypothetical protein